MLQKKPGKHRPLPRKPAYLSAAGYMGAVDLLLSLSTCPARIPRWCSDWPLWVALGLAWASLAVWWLGRRVG